MDYCRNATAILQQNSTPIVFVQQCLEYLDLQEFLKKDLPVTVLLGILSIIGLIGNLNAILVFSRYPESSVKILVLRLVGTDLLTCLICIPLEIVQIRYSYTYPSSHLCKITRFLTYFTSLTAGTFLIVLAVERRQKICAPFKWQLSTERSKVLSYAFIILNGLISIPATFFYDVYDKNTQIPGIMGNTCKELKHTESHIVVNIYVISVVATCFIGFLICVVSYVQIVMIIRQQIRREKTRTTQYRETIFGQENPSSPEVIKRLNSISQDTLDAFTSTLQRRKTKRKRYKDSRTTTLMLLIATGISFLGFVLHVTAVIIKKTVSKQTLNDMEIVHSMLLRAYYIHSALHPIVYCLVDKKFRLESKQIYERLRKSCTTQNR